MWRFLGSECMRVDLVAIRLGDCLADGFPRTERRIQPAAVNAARAAMQARPPLCGAGGVSSVIRSVRRLAMTRAVMTWPP
jgi:hypothetical protein